MLSQVDMLSQWYQSGNFGAKTNNYFAEMCSGSEAGSYLRLIDLVYHSTLGLSVTKKKRRSENLRLLAKEEASHDGRSG